MIDHLLTSNVLPEMSREFLARVARRDGIGRMTLELDEGGGLAFRCE
jgi:hypothetical protein